MRPLRSVVALLLSVLPLSATEPYEQELSTALVKHVLVLRNFYTDAHLKFDSNGVLTSKSPLGFGPIEGRIYVREVKLEPSRLTITGSRPLSVFDDVTETLRLVDIRQPVSITFDLPDSEAPRHSIPELLKDVFLPSRESSQLECSADEAGVFRKDAKSAIRHINVLAVPNPATEPSPEANSLSELKQVCYPIGDRAYRVGHGIAPPKPLKTPDPSYPPGASRAGQTGTVVVMLIVDAGGAPTSIILTRSVGADLDEAAIKAIRSWKFAPATFKGSPVPVAIHVEVNFTLK
jgi:TonB family protein